ncbi:hypothetical protein CPB84DRAFT_241779 [Gymnopilus junonius]|uniref:Uncharacterized protein n=1 Tax=Gymnopilus junonius TaxID=109634 RepID=A0A9P5NVA2_GYMJU|nr:hypothetical protein CPB84DRAFT_241779 [Gymnopilus junonius]
MRIPVYVRELVFFLVEILSRLFGDSHYRCRRSALWNTIVSPIHLYHVTCAPPERNFVVQCQCRVEAVWFLWLKSCVRRLSLFSVGVECFSGVFSVWRYKMQFFYNHHRTRHDIAVEAPPRQPTGFFHHPSCTTPRGPPPTTTSYPSSLQLPLLKVRNPEG